MVSILRCYHVSLHMFPLFVCIKPLKQRRIKCHIFIPQSFHFLLHTFPRPRLYLVKLSNSVRWKKPCGFYVIWVVESKNSGDTFLFPGATLENAIYQKRKFWRFDFIFYTGDFRFSNFFTF